MAQNQSNNQGAYPIQQLPDGRVRYSDGSVGWPQSRLGGAFINTNTPRNSAGELINPTPQDVAQFNSRYTTTRTNQGATSSGGLSPTQITGLNAASTRIANGTASQADRDNVAYAQRTYGYNYGQSSGSQSQAAVDKLYTDAVSKNPAINTLMQGGSTLDEIINGLSTGNLSGIVDWQGKPFSTQDQQDALTKANNDNKLYYEALQQKETANVESKLASDKANYQDYLISSGQAFESDKATMDEQAANNGILFSGSRTQKQKNLERAYSQDQASKMAQYGNSIGSAANDFQYKYGADAANRLNQYYSLGGNTFNASTARNGVGSGGLSNIYTPSKYNYQGTVNTERSANSNVRAAGYLWNKGNKLLATGYQNKY